MTALRTIVPTWRARRLAGALLIATLVLTACGGSSDGDDAVGDAVGVNERDGGSPDGEGASPPGPDGEGTDGGGGGTAAPGPGKADGATDGGDRGPLRTDIPEPGRYTYEVTGEGAGSPQLLDVVDYGERRGDVRQRWAVHSGDTSAGVRHLVVWIEGGEHQGLWIEAEQRSSEDTVAPPCVWNPTYLQTRLPLASGMSWESKARCHIEDEGGEEGSDGPRRERRVTVEVGASRSADVGGRQVEVWELRRTTTTLQEIPGGLQTVEIVEATELFAPDEGLVVHSAETHTSTVNGVPHDTWQRTLRLLSLDPKPIPEQDEQS